PVGADPLPLDVFCVEHGRWSSGGNFSAAKTIVHPSVREQAAVNQKQSDVWNAVRSGTTSPVEVSRAGSGGGAAAPAPRVSGEALARPNYREVADRDDAEQFLVSLRGVVKEETEPGVYRWREINHGRLSQIELDALEPKAITLHRLLLRRTN